MTSFWENKEELGRRGGKLERHAGALEGSPFNKAVTPSSLVSVYTQEKDRKVVKKLI